ncbi:plasminogen activator inhibitor 1 RNA-binding protein-like [Episyrphus balteatus]|uniref:plasminogen activator inhibitor 1 RNA-binding protein-like n=1 Tax=Episyrphus balteatus TaxID=286459 RepID=UPI0024862724|nr:plasminogen activator inhibitor 1 RNA-binding protein-like [Episyrphus balteatus]
MDNSGKNRYELLFMDDDVSDPLDNIIKKKVKQPAAAAAAAGGGAAVTAPPTAVTTSNKGQTNNTNKQNASSANDSSKKNSSEKENKSFAMNKNVDFNNRKSNAASGNNTASASAGGGGGSGGLSKSNKSNQQQLSNNNQNSNRTNRDNFNGPASQNRNSTSKPQNGESREQRNNRRNRENGVSGSLGGNAGGIGEYNNDSLQQNQQQQQRIRQNNQRFNGPPRNRSGADGSGNVRGGKREFDRQSGSDKTGVKAVDKRDGAGAHNWGSVKQDIEDINKSNDEAGLTDKEESGNDQTAAEQNASIEEETKELTLDEWKAQRQQRAKPQFNIRKAGEGEDVTQWKKMIALNNKKKEGDSEEELEYDPSMYPQRVGRLQRVLDIQFHFNDGRRGGGGMGRGRGRGSRPTGGAERPVGGGGGGGSGGVGSGNAGGASGVGAPVAPLGGGRPEGPRVNVGRPRNENPRREGGGMDKQQRGGQHAPKVDDERQFPTLS